jgi:flagellar assembly protein FliH
MAVHSKLISFDRPLLAAVGAGDTTLRHTETELANARTAGYRDGYDAAHAFFDVQIAQFRDEVHALQHGLLHSLPNLEAGMTQQLRSGLPLLALDIARRILAGFEPDADLLVKLCEEALEQLYPERENLELVVSTRDAGLLQKNMADIESRYPGLRLRVDATMRPGDCQVRSRFGLTDARLDAKLSAIHHELAGS